MARRLASLSGLLKLKLPPTRITITPARTTPTRTMSRNTNQNKQDILVPTFEPHKPVVPLGQDLLHGLPREKHIVVVLGVGPGLGLAIAQTFAAQGYAVAILSRTKSRLDAWAKELDASSRAFLSAAGLKAPSGPLSQAFACDGLDNESIKSAIKDIQAAWPDRHIGTGIFNFSVRKRGPFLEQRPEQIRDGVQASIFASFTFLQAVIGAMEQHNQGLGGSIIVTGATSSTRGREGFAGFAASKSGLRAICQSVAREYGPKNIHVAHVIVDGLIESQQAIDFFGMPKGSRFPDGAALLPPQMAKAWLFLAQQHPSCWTFEMDMRPAKEHF